MAHYLYAKPDGEPDITEYKLNLALFPGYVYLGASGDRPDVGGRKWDGKKWIWGGSKPEYLAQRDMAYPNKQDLLLALWRAMDEGLLPKVPGFYDTIKEVNDRFPPP